jgi:hypothetical protein
MTDGLEGLALMKAARMMFGAGDPGIAAEREPQSA